MRLTPTEAELQRAIMDLLRAERVPAMRFNSGTLRNPRGVPVSFARWMDGSPVSGMADIMALVHGRAVFLEVKAHGGKQRPAQVEFARWALAAGACYAVVRSAADVRAALAGAEAAAFGGPA